MNNCSWKLLPLAKYQSMKEATFGAGCFWCVEACFKDLKGVHKVESGYAGGKTVNPTYEAVCAGITGHAEVVRITYDEKQLSFKDLLEVFFFVHDPTQLNRQGNDIGTQYRSVIFYHNEEQKVISLEVIKSLTEENAWKDPIVTEVSPLKNYFSAENYHQNYLHLNPQNTYCQMVVRPKYEKFKKIFRERLN
jgi:peptide-methionine (S)-S-oxide reductase